MSASHCHHRLEERKEWGREKRQKTPTQQINWDVIVRKEWKKRKKVTRDAKGHEGEKATEEPFDNGIERMGCDVV